MQELEVCWKNTLSKLLACLMGGVLSPIFLSNSVLKELVLAAAGVAFSWELCMSPLRFILNSLLAIKD